MLSKVEIDILKNLYDSGLINEMESRTIRRISENIGLNYFRVRSNVNHLVLLGYIKQGFRERQSNAFYISTKGVEEIEKINP